MDWKKALFGEPEKRTVPEEPSLGGGTILEWLNLSQLGALNISTFFQGVDLISSSIAQLPIYTKKKDGKGQSNIIKNHPTNLLWNDPTNLVSKDTMLKAIVQNVICKGNAYCLINRADDGTPVSLHYVESSDITISYNKDTGELYYTTRFAKGRVVKPEDILHFKLHTWDGVKGISLLSFANQSVEIASATSEQAKNFFKKSCSKISGVIQSQSILNSKQKDQILAKWANTFTTGASGVGILDGNMSYTPITISPDDAQLLESRQFNQADVCHFLGINPAQLGVKDYSNYSSFEDAQNEFFQRTLMPYIVMIESELSRKLLKDTEQKNVKIILDTAAFLRPNKQSEATYYSTLIDKGVLSRNEVREILGFNKVDGLDDYVIPYTDISQNTLGGNNEENNKTDDGNKELQQ